MLWVRMIIVFRIMNINVKQVQEIQVRNDIVENVALLS